MEIIIRRLCPELAEDYLDFFDHRAFTDHSPEGPCYCTRFQMTQEEEMAAGARFGDPCFGTPEFTHMLREVAREQVMKGLVRGYLAYANGLSIGWCNVNDKENLPERAGNGARHHASAAEKARAVLCFEIAPEYRGQGVATALLERAVADAKADGCRSIEGYPISRDVRYPWDFPGPVALYEKLGFEKAGERDGALVMKKQL